jgi:hypothetical protein
MKLLAAFALAVLALVPLLTSAEAASCDMSGYALNLASRPSMAWRPARTS